jgi:hypothetical protein
VTSEQDDVGGAGVSVPFVPSPDDMLHAVTDSIAERTGRTMDEWVALVGGSGVDPLDQNAVRGWLRDVHGVRQNTQWAIADAAARAAGWVRPTVEQYIDQQYTGARPPCAPSSTRCAPPPWPSATT